MWSLDSRNLARVEGELLGGDRVVEVFELGGADDRRGHAWLVEEPGECDLRR